MEAGPTEVRRGPLSGDRMELGVRRVVWAALTCALYACGGDAPTGPAGVAEIAITPAPATVRVGETILFSATPKDQAGKPLTGRQVTWTSVNATIASISAAGIATGISEGTTDISAIVDGTIATVALTVTPTRVASVEVRPVVAEILVGATIQMTATPRSGTGALLVGRAVAWASSDTTIARVSSTGLVTGLTGGEVVITATSELQVGQGDLGIIDPTAPRIQAITPFPLVEGGSATINGVNFGSSPVENAVTVDGVAAVVTAADGTSLTFTVPGTGCRPYRSVSVRVTAGGKSGSRSHPLRPAAFTQVAVGDHVLLGSSTAPCLQFDTASVFQTYLVGVQSTAESASSLTTVQVASRTGLTAAGAAAASIATAGSAVPTLSALAPMLDGEAHSLLESRSTRHLEARRAESAFLDSGPLDFSAAATGALQSPVPPNATVGQRFAVRVPPHYPGSCTEFSTIQAELRHISGRGHWLVDVANLVGTYTANEIQELASIFEDDVAPALEPMFGAIPDTDANPRMAFVITQRVNQEGWLSYPSLYDYLPTSQCAASNQGDLLYLATPASGLSSSFLLSVMGLSLAHDFTHVIQNRAVIAGGQRAPAWIEEGQAGLGEEVYSHRVLGLQPRQNYGRNIIFSQIGQFQPYGIVSSLAFHFGFQDATSPRATGAPEQCTWLDPADGGTATSGPCRPPGPSAGAWAFLRWLTDHYGQAVGGDGILHQGLIDASGPGFARVSTLVGVPIETLLARFGASLYTDDRVVPVEPTLDFPSWNLLEYDDAVFATARLAPRERGYTTYTDAGAVRGASTLYYRISASGRPATAIEVTGPAGAPLGASARVWIVRMQ